MKTRYNKLNFALLLILVINTSCNNELIDTSKNLQDTEVKIKSEYNLLNYSPNVYHDYFKQTDNTLGFSSLKPNALKPHNIVQRTKFSEKGSRKSISINNISIETVSKSKRISLNKSSDIYGKNVRFTVNTPNSNLKTGDDNSEVEMYVPELIEITNPSVTNVKERYPLCDANDFVLEWNADSNNEEGLVVIAEYFGGNAIPENSQDIHILNTDFIEIDNGRTSLSTDLFQDIPNLSIVHIVLLRGNIAIEEIEGELYKFYAESHMRLPIILVKDVNTIVKLD